MGLLPCFDDSIKTVWSLLEESPLLFESFDDELGSWWSNAKFFSSSRYLYSFLLNEFDQSDSFLCDVNAYA